MPGILEGNPVLYFLAATTALKFAVWHFLEKKQWRLVGRVSAVYLYPVKSARSITVAEGHCTKSGLLVDEIVRDRHWLLVTSDNRLVTLVREPTLALLQPSIHGTTMQLDAPGMDTLQFQMDIPATNNTVQTKVSGVLMTGLDCGPKVSTWISKYLGKDGYKLIYCGPKIRPRSMSEGPDKWHKGDADDVQVANLGFSPFMVMSEASVTDVKEKVPTIKNLTVDRFRPNILISDCDAFAEDQWNKIRIGNVQLSYTKLCTRCPATTIDQQNGKMDKSLEPLKTLRSYRSIIPGFNQTPCMGVYMQLDTPGVVHVGDSVYAIKHGPGFEY